MGVCNDVVKAVWRCCKAKAGGGTQADAPGRVNDLGDCTVSTAHHDEHPEASPGTSTFKYIVVLIVVFTVAVQDVVSIWLVRVHGEPLVADNLGSVAAVLSYDEIDRDIRGETDPIHDRLGHCNGVRRATCTGRSSTGMRVSE